MWLHQTKKALNSKGNNQQNQQVTNWKGENTYKSRMSDKGLVSGKKSIAKIKTIWSKKRAEDLNKHSSKEDIQMANRYVKRGTGVPIVRETQIKTTRCHPTPIRMAITRELSPQGNRAWWPATRLDANFVVDLSVAAWPPVATSLWWEVWEVLKAGSMPGGEGAGCQRAGPSAPFPGVGSPQPKNPQETHTALCALLIPNALPQEVLQTLHWHLP